MHKRVLIVAYYFPPVAAAGGMRPLGFSRYLESYGWQPRVLTCDPASVFPIQGVDEQLAARLPKTLQINAASYRNPIHRLVKIRNTVRDSIRTVLKCSGHTNETDSSGLGRPAPSSRKRTSLRDLAVHWTFWFPDEQRFWLRPAIDQFSQLARDPFPDVILATAPPWTSFLVGKTLAERYGIPFVADFRDPWTDNPFNDFLSPYLVHKSKQVERSVCASAVRVITTTEELREKLCIAYPEMRNKFVTIPNGFDRESFVLQGGAKATVNAPSACLHGSGLEFCHFGSVYGTRSPLNLFQAVLELYEAGQLSAKQIRMRFVGEWEVSNNRCDRLAQELEKHGVLRREGPLSYLACLKQMAQASALLVLQPDSPLQIPGKLYEYIATGRPLLAIAGEGATFNLVQRHHLGTCCPNKVSDIKRLFQGIVTGRVPIECPPEEAKTRFDYRVLTRELASVLDQIYSKDHICGRSS